MKTALCTISANNFLPYGLTCLYSAKKFNGYDFFYLIADEFRPELYEKYNDDIAFVSLDEIGKTSEELNQLEFKYNLVEFNTCVKPSFYQYLFSQGYDNVIYLDPDIECYNEFSYLDSLLQTYSIVITPHKISKTDSTFLQENDFLNNGIYNLGFIAMHKCNETISFLKWWDSMLKDGCYLDYGRGLATDQIWINLVPIYFDKVCICKHYGMNVAFWNIDERSLSYSTSKGWYANEGKLLFIHFSSLGVDCKKCLLEKIFNISPFFKNIYLEHIENVKQFNFDQYKTIKYKFNYFNNGKRIPNEIKRFYGYSNREFLNPFDTEKGSFYSKLNRNQIRPIRNSFSSNERLLKIAIKIFSLKTVLWFSRYLSAINVNNISKLYE